jgi:1-acyl-sn-glycerol-3-phosphate acyltransferase
MSFFYRASRLSLKSLFSMLYSHKTHLPEELLPNQGAIIAANHASFLDPPLIAVSWPEPIHFLARKELFYNPVLRAIITNLNAHPVGTTGDTTASIKLACKLLQEGKKVLIFPEGTRSSTGDIEVFKSGITLLAKRSGCPVIPAYIHGSFDLWPRTRARPYFFGHKTACLFGPPIGFQDGLPALVQREVEKLREKYVLGAN